MRIERLEVPFDHCPKCMSKSIDGAFFVPRDGFQFEQIECYCCGHNWEIKSRFLADETLFETITTSPEVLAEKFVIKQINQFGGSSYKAILLVDEYDNYRDFYSREQAIAATAEKLKEVCNGND